MWLPGVWDASRAPLHRGVGVGDDGGDGRSSCIMVEVVLNLKNKLAKK